MSDLRAYYERCDALGISTVVTLPPSEIAHVLAEMRCHGTHVFDFNDLDGACEFFLRNGDLLLRTARGEVKGVVNTDDAYSDTTGRPITPLGRFLTYCRGGGISSEQAMYFATAL
jgi:hypothetical protein